MMANFDPSPPLPSLESSLRQTAVAIAPVQSPQEPTTPAPGRPGDDVTPPRADDEFVLYGRLGYVLRSRLNHA